MKYILNQAKLYHSLMFQEIINDLEEYIRQSDLVILVDINCANPMTDMLCRSNALLETSRRVVIISVVNMSIKYEKHIYRTVTELEMRILLEIYRLYESSDRLLLFTDSRNYGSTWNYVNNGLLSSEEMLDALMA